MSGIMHALWRLANPVSGTLCLDRPPSGFRGIGRCVLDVGHESEAHMDTKGNTWSSIEIEYDEEGDAWPWI